MSLLDSAAPLRLVRAAILGLLVAAAAPAAAQSFAVGAGGGAIADLGANVARSGFHSYGGYGFLEVSLENSGSGSDVRLQLRGELLRLPGGAPAAPDLDVSSGLVVVSYLWREEWWEAGLMAGLGVFGVSPKSPGSDQVAADPSQTVFGWCAGAQSVFRISRRADFRLEASWQVPSTQLDHKFFFLTGGFAYRF
ncbi:MAG: hypothetical protein ACHQPI_12980 [Thermoanaerobaculia bacterium]